MADKVDLSHSNLVSTEPKRFPLTSNEKVMSADLKVSTRSKMIS